MNIVKYSKDGFENLKNIRKAIITVDAQLFSVFKIDNAHLSMSDAKKSIPFTLEPKLLDDISDLEFFINKKNTVFSIVVIAKSILENLKQDIKKHKIDVVGVYPEFMFVPCNDEKITYREVGEDNVIFRSGVVEGGNIPKKIFLEMFDEEHIILSDKKSNDYNIINLLTYDITEIWQKFIKPYIAIIILFALSFVVSFTTTTLQNFKNRDILEHLKNYNTTLFKSSFPDVKQVVDIRVQTEQKMKSLSAQQQLVESDFLTHLLSKNIGKQHINSLTFDTNAKNKLEIK